MLKVIYRDVHRIMKGKELQQAILSLKNSRKNEILAKTNIKAQLQSTAVTLLLEELLEKNGIEEYEMNKDPLGKPYFSTPKEVFVSLSHSYDMVACAISNHPVGIDVQFMKEFSYTRFSNRFFSEEEREQLAMVSNDEKKKIFYQIWTAKESYQKMIGQGIVKALGSIIVQCKEQIVTNRSGKSIGKISFMQENEYCICVCTTE